MEDDTNIFSFWRNRAKLSWLSGENLLRILLIVVAGVIGLGFLLVVPNWRVIGMEEVTVRLVCGVGLAVVAPAILALEMFYKGGRAAIDLERDGKMLLGERADDTRRVEKEFNSYRIKREQEFKDIEDNRGKEIARLQATIAELESSINSALIVEPVEKLADNDATFRVTLVVRNDSPLAANNVSVVVDSIQVINTSDGNMADGIIDRLTGLRLLPRVSDEKGSFQVTIPGHTKKEFFFLDASKENRNVSIINELCVLQITMDPLATEHAQCRVGALPKGHYRLGLIVASHGRGSLRLSCTITTAEREFLFLVES